LFCHHCFAIMHGGNKTMKSLGQNN